MLLNSSQERPWLQVHDPCLEQQGSSRVQPVRLTWCFSPCVKSPLSFVPLDKRCPYLQRSMWPALSPLVPELVCTLGHGVAIPFYLPPLKYFFFVCGTGVEFRASSSLDRRSTTWTTPPASPSFRAPIFLSLTFGSHYAPCKSGRWDSCSYDIRNQSQDVDSPWPMMIQLTISLP